MYGILSVERDNPWNYYEKIRKTSRKRKQEYQQYDSPHDRNVLRGKIDNSIRIREGFRLKKVNEKENNIANYFDGGYHYHIGGLNFRGILRPNFICGVFFVRH